ncbi:MAG: class II glutamine amidotransferase [Proteobacteria bacterium]|nr:class II glutamine amidotransferase [Pseudomonadota bacterium]
MCRLYGFRSAIESSVHQSLVAADNALARQSERHRDGWGLGFYVGPFPHVIRNDEQALGDVLFREVSGIVATRTFVAHIRQATVGAPRVLNCHPFQYGRWLLAHNGEIAGFARPEVQRRVRDCVDDRFRRFVLGDTDSEVLFFIFLSQLARRVENLHDEGVRIAHVLPALRAAIAQVLAVAPEVDQERPNRLTILLTNGNLMLAYRRGRECYYSTYKTRCPERASCYAFDASRCEGEAADGIVKHLVVASEPVSSGPNVWRELEDNYCLCLDHGMNLHAEPLLV